MLLVTAAALVWIALLLVVLAMCRAAALGDAPQRVRVVDRTGRVSFPGRPLIRRGRSSLG